MEYTIVKNDYVKPTEVRPEVVQRLLDFYVQTVNTCWNEFCSNSCWRRTHSIGRRGGRDEMIGNTTQATGEFTDVVRIRTCEMREFFKVWIGAGYYISRGYYRVGNQTAILYKFTKKPYTDYGYKVVTEFSEDID